MYALALAQSALASELGHAELLVLAAACHRCGRLGLWFAAHRLSVVVSRFDECVAVFWIRGLAAYLYVSDLVVFHIVVCCDKCKKNSRYILHL